MKTQSLLVLGALAAGALAHPVAKRDDIDATILQFALTLEHLENAFYKGALSTMPESEFIDAGFTSEYYQNLKYIAHDEEQHVLLLESGLKAAGAMPVEACTYNFPYTDVKSFITLSSVLEGVGTSAYLGGAPLITSKDYLSIAGSILVAEALHTSLQRYSLGEVAAANPYGTALGPNPVFTLAASFIGSCPASNAPLPFKPFPALTAVQGTPTAPGMSFEFSVKGSLPASFFVTFCSGLTTMSVAATMNGEGMIMTTVPDMAAGQTYAFVTSGMVNGTVMDSDILFGPAILEVTPPSPTFDVSVLKD